MLQSQVNLDHRLAELRRTSDELRQAHAVRGAGQPARTLVTTIRSLLWRGLRDPEPSIGAPATLAAAPGGAE